MSFTRYGDIMKVHTPGYTGAQKSVREAQADEGRMEKYRSKINSVARRRGIDPALIAAIISRESNAGHTLDEGWGDNRKAWGLMQVDVTPNGGNHPKIGAWDSEEHLNHATGILVDFIEEIQKKFPHWNKEMALKGGIAAYNAGDRNIRSENVDAYTTGGDYSSDVVTRAKWFKNNANY